MTPAYQHPDAIVSTDWLAANLADPSLRIFECTTYLLYRPAGSDVTTISRGIFRAPGFSTSRMICPTTARRRTCAFECCRRMSWPRRLQSKASATLIASFFTHAVLRHGRRACGGCCAASASITPL